MCQCLVFETSDRNTISLNSEEKDILTSSFPPALINEQQYKPNIVKY